MRSSRLRRGFTLIELLVVIGIIALLISILIPTLSNARAAASRTKCLSNMRQLATTLHMYASESRGCFPPHLLGISNYETDWAFFAGWKNPPNAYAADGYVGLGYLVRSRLVKDGKAFYCPDMVMGDYMYESYQRIWEAMSRGDPLTNKDRLHFGYLYRPFGSDQVPYITAAEVDKINNLKLGKPKGIFALVTEVPYNGGRLCWSHNRPWGLNVAYTDGHAQFVTMSKAERDAAADLARTNLRFDMFCYFQYLYFAIDRNDMPQFTKYVMARDWNGAMQHYGHF